MSLAAFLRRTLIKALAAVTTALLMGCLPSTETRVKTPASLEFSCSQFPAELAESDLIERYGTENVLTKMVHWGEYRGLGTVLFADNPHARVQIIWKESTRRPYLITVSGESPSWIAASGIRTGMKLQELARLNERPFRLAGFQTEMAGAVLDWDGGRLEPPEAVNCKLSITLQPKWDGTEDFELVKQVRSGREYSSDHPAMQSLNPTVVEMQIRH